MNIAPQKAARPIIFVIFTSHLPSIVERHSIQQDLTKSEQRQMADYLTAEEAKKRNAEHRGEPLGTLFHALWQETAWLYAKWAEYVELFGTKESRIELLKRRRATFFPNHTGCFVGTDYSSYSMPNRSTRNRPQREFNNFGITKIDE